MAFCSSHRYEKKGSAVPPFQFRLSLLLALAEEVFLARPSTDHVLMIREGQWIPAARTKVSDLRQCKYLGIMALSRQVMIGVMSPKSDYPNYNLLITLLTKSHEPVVSLRSRSC